MVSRQKQAPNSTIKKQSKLSRRIVAGVNKAPAAVNSDKILHRIITGIVLPFSRVWAAVTVDCFHRYQVQLFQEVVLSLAKVTEISIKRKAGWALWSHFPPVDIDNIRNDTKPQIKGQEEGDAGIPFKQATALSATENAILAEFERVQHIYVNTHDRMQSAYVTRVNALAHEWKLDAIENEEEEKVNKVIARAKQQANEILRPMEKLRASGRELLKYRELHNLTGRLPACVAKQVLDSAHYAYCWADSELLVDSREVEPPACCGACTNFCRTKQFSAGFIRKLIDMAQLLLGSKPNNQQ